MGRLPLVALAFLVFQTVAWAQVSSATLTGIVADPSQARLPGINVELTNEDTGVSAAAVTNAQGEYTFSLLPPGRYRLAATATGFRAYSRSGLVLELGRVTRLDLSLELGQVAQTVEVSGAAPLLESESSTVSQFIENKTIVDMPLNGRRVGELLGLMGNAVFVTGDVIRPASDDRRRARGPSAVDDRWRQLFKYRSGNPSSALQSAGRRRTGNSGSAEQLLG